MENKKRKISGLILAGTTVAGVASAAANTTSASFSDLLGKFSSVGSKLKNAGSFLVKKAAQHPVASIAVGAVFVISAILLFVYNRVKNQELSVVDDEKIKGKLKQDFGIKEGVDFKESDNIESLANISNWAESLQTIKNGEKYEDLTLKFEQNEDPAAALNTFLKVASKLNTGLKGFWYCSNLKEINDGTETQKATLKFMKLGDFVTKQQETFKECNFEKIIEQHKERLNLMLFGYMYVKEQFFYEFLSASGFLQVTLDPRGYEGNLMLIGGSTYELLKKDDVLSKDNKQFLKNMENALELYKQELDEYIKYKKQKGTDENRRAAINSHEFYKFILLNCIEKLKSNDDSDTKTNYLFFAKLVATGALGSRSYTDQSGIEEAKKRCQVLLNVKEKLNSLDVNNISKETLKEISEELKYYLFSLDDLKNVFSDNSEKDGKIQNKITKDLGFENYESCTKE